VPGYWSTASTKKFSILGITHKATRAPWPSQRLVGPTTRSWNRSVFLRASRTMCPSKNLSLIGASVNGAAYCDEVLQCIRRETTSAYVRIQVTGLWSWGCRRANHRPPLELPAGAEAGLTWLDRVLVRTARRSGRDDERSIRWASSRELSPVPKKQEQNWFMITCPFWRLQYRDRARPTVPTAYQRHNSSRLVRAQIQLLKSSVLVYT